ncbi:MAG: potassium channel protein [Myxococcota bacterium]
MEEQRRFRLAEAFRMGPSIAVLAAGAERRQRVIRVARATALLILMLAVGSYGYYLLTDGRYAAIDCLYMTLITVSTVGYDEHIPADTDALKSLTMGLILFGGASLLYFLSSLAAYLIEGDLAYGIWRRRQLKRITKLEGHVVVCGAGATGAHAAAEVARSRAPLLVVAKDAARVEQLALSLGDAMLFVIGDATDDASLRLARLDHALGLVAALPDDRDNLMLCVTARQLAPALPIVVRVSDDANVETFEALGVNAVVEPAHLGGSRIADLMLRPHLVAFSEAMLATEAHQRGLVEVTVTPGSPAEGLSLAEAALGARTGCLVLGIRPRSRTDYLYAPDPDARLSGGGAVVALARPKELRKLRRLVSRSGRRLRPLEGSVSSAPRLESASEWSELASQVSARATAATTAPPRDSPASQAEAALRPQVIVGCGAVGRRLVDDFGRQGVHRLVIDREESILLDLPPPDQGGPATLLGDATDRAVLARAGLPEAAGMAIVLNSDRDNLFLCLLARHANPRLRIIVRADDPSGRGRLLAAGADDVVAPAALGGVRLAHELLHPGLAAFSDALLASEGHTARLRAFPIATGSVFAGLRLEEARITERSGCVVIAVRRRGRGAYRYHPPPTYRLRAGGALMVLGEVDEFETLGDMISSTRGVGPH